MNNPLKYTDESGQFWHFVVGAIVGGAVNVISNWGNIHSVGNFFAYFGTGALSGVATAAGMPMLGAAILTGGNNLISQVNTNGWGHINYLQLAGSSALGAVTAWGGDAIAKAVTPYLSNFTSLIASPVLSNAILQSATNAISGFAVGTGMAFASGKSIGDALTDGLSGALQGAEIGAISGSIDGYIQAKQQGVGAFSGRSEQIEQPPLSSVSITDAPIDAPVTATNIRTDPAGLSEQLAMKQAKTGAGTTVIEADKINDPKYPGGHWVKRDYTHHLPDKIGNINIHYMYNTLTHEMRDFKFTSPIYKGTFFKFGKYFRPDNK